MKYECQHCGHEWNSRIETKPIACPKCKRYDWEKLDLGVSDVVKETQDKVQEAIKNANEIQDTDNETDKF